MWKIYFLILMEFSLEIFVNLPTCSGKHSHGKVMREFLRLLLPFSIGPSSKCLPRDSFSCWLVSPSVDFYWAL